MLKKLKSKEGSISVLGIILTLIIFTVIAGYLSILKSSWVLNEVQSVMDIAGLNTLRKSLDNQALRKEIVGVIDDTTGTTSSDMSIESDGTRADTINLSKVNNKLMKVYKAELNRNISTNDVITDFNLVSFDSDLVYTDWGISSRNSKPQIRLDAIVQVKIKADSKFDAKNNYNINFFNARSGEDFSINVAGVTGDGEVILTVRTVSRLLYSQV